MLVGAIISLVIVVTLFVLILVFSRYPKKDNYDIKTKPSKLIYGLSHFFFCFMSLGMNIGVLVMVLISEDGEIAPALVPMLDIAGGLFGLLVVYFTHIQFEAIKDDTVYYRRFIKIKTINIKDITSVAFIPGRGFYVYLMDKAAFSMDQRTVGGEDLANLIQERKKNEIFFSNSSNPSSDPASLSDEDAKKVEIFKQIGAELRANFKNYKRNKLLSTSLLIFSIIGFAIALLLYIYFKRNNPMMLLYVVFALVAVVVTIASIIKLNGKYNQELNKDDITLGYDHRLENKKVKGHSKRIFISSIPLFAMIGSFCLVAALMSAFFSHGVFTQPIKCEDMVEVTGQFEYIRTITDRYGYEYAIGLIGDTNEYRISDTYLMNFDNNFRKEVSIGTPVTLRISPKDSFIDLKFRDKTSYTYAYTLKTDSKEYLSYSGYIASFKQDHLDAKIVFIVSTSIFGLSFVGLSITYLVAKQNSKKETIEI